MNHVRHLPLIAIACGIPLVSSAIANAITDTTFFVLKLGQPEFWAILTDRSAAAPASVFDVTQSGVAVAFSILFALLIARVAEIDLKAMLKWGSFDVVFPLLVIMAPFIFAVPNLLLRKIFGIAADCGCTPGSDWGLTATLLTFALFVPVQEEVVWRGYLVGAFEKRQEVAKITLIAVSIGFALIHLPSDIGILRALGILPGALALTWLRLKSGGIIWPFLFHAFGNFALFVGPVSPLVTAIIYPTS